MARTRFTYTETERKPEMDKCTLDTRVFCYRMARKDGTGEFVSTRCRDEKGHVHGLALDQMTWDAMAAEGINALDVVVFEGVLELPAEGTQEFADAKVTNKRTGETYVSGELRNPRPVAFEKGIFKSASFPKFADLPLYQKRAAGPSLMV